MEGTDSAFFYTARRFGLNNVVLCLTETSLDSWEARVPYLSAKAEKRRLDMYQMDLLWLLVKRHYDNLPKPSDIEYESVVRDMRTAKQIQEDIIKKLGGEA